MSPFALLAPWSSRSVNETRPRLKLKMKGPNLLFSSKKACYAGPHTKYWIADFLLIRQKGNLFEDNSTHAILLSKTSGKVNYGYCGLAQEQRKGFTNLNP